MNLMRSSISCLALLTLMLWLLSSPAIAQEVHSNGRGGGDWSDPTSWHGNRVPTAEDDVVIAMRDTIAFDMNHSDRITCRNLYLDPEGILTFKPGREDSVLTLDGSIESYGIIRVDGTANARSAVKLRFVATDAEPRAVTMFHHAAMFIYGHDRTRRNERNAVVYSEALSDEQPAPQVNITANGKAMIDIQRAELVNTHLVFSDIDNTNTASDERLNIIDNSIMGLSRIHLTRCDTPTIRGNVFDLGEHTTQHPAIRIDHSSLAEIRNNTITGGFPYAIFVHGDTDSSCMGNVVRGAAAALRWHGNNGVIKENLFEDCVSGIVFAGGGGTIEDVRIVRPKTGIAVTSATLQLTNFDVAELQEEGVAMSLNASAITLLNSSIADDQIRVTGGAPPGTADWVELMCYLVVQVTGQVPAQTQVMVETSSVSGGVPQGRADLNVRNAPARLSDRHWSPMPASQRALVVRSWRIGRDQKRVNAPFYEIKVQAPDATGEMKLLKQVRVEPTDNWFRPNPNAAVATVEVSLP